eukprot:gene6246-10254_t
MTSLNFLGHQVSTKEHQNCVSLALKALKLEFSKLSFDLLSHDPEDVTITVHTDASSTGIGGFLSYHLNNNPENEKVVSFNSRSTKNSELNYSVPKLELLSIVYNLDTYKHFLI